MITGLALLSTLVLFAGFAIQKRPPPAVIVHFLDVGQGDAILIDAGGGMQVLIDGGPNRTALAELGAVMPFWDRRIELMIATHPDLDHYGGLVYVLERYEVSAVIVNTSADTLPYRRFLALARAKSRIVPAQGQTFELNPGSFEIIDPLTMNARPSAGDRNNNSIVSRLRAWQHTVLLTGDAEAAEERRLQNQGSVRADILKVGHHGSKSSSSESFLTAVSPRWCIISVGKKNRYHHPNPEALRRLGQTGCQALRTDQVGRITITFTASRTQLKTER